jgi:hypothetical protein
VLPALQAAIKSKIRDDETWSLHPDEDDPDRQTLLFDYPTSFAPDAAAYIRRAVKIEMGARADHWPSEMKTITSYVAETFTTGFREANVALKVLSVERTFWGEGDDSTRRVSPPDRQGDAGAILAALQRLLRVDP